MWKLQVLAATLQALLGGPLLTGAGAAAEKAVGEALRKRYTRPGGCSDRCHGSGDAWGVRGWDLPWCAMEVRFIRQNCKLWVTPFPVCADLRGLDEIEHFGAKH